MKRQNRVKSVIAIFCICVLLSGYVWNDATLVTQASQSQSENTIMPEDLGYERVTLEDFGIEEKTYKVGDGMTGKSYQKDSTLEGKYLDINVDTAPQCCSWSAATCISYAGGSSGWEGLRIYMMDKHIAFGVTSNLENAYMQYVELEPLNLTGNDQMNLKIAVSKSGTALKVDVWVENVYQPQMVFEGSASILSNCLGIYAVDQDITVGIPTVTKDLGAVAYNLADSDNGYLITTSGTAYVNGTEYTDLSAPLNTPGNYVVKKDEGTEIFTQNVALYYTGDANLDGACGTQADYDAMQDILLGKTESVAGEKAGDLNNDGVLDIADLALMEEVVNQTKSLTDIIAQYDVPALTYDFLGGDTVMPISGYYGPYSMGLVQNEKTYIYSYLEDDIFKLIADSGINMINHTNNDYTNEASAIAIETALEKAEKYGLGMLVTDGALYDSNGDGTYVNMTNVGDIASRIGKYSQYNSFLGMFLCDEPYTEEYNTYGAAIFQGTAEETAKVKNYANYKGIANTLNQYANLQGYINLLSLSTSNYPDGWKTNFGVAETDATKIAAAYDTYLNLTLDQTNGANAKILSFDKYLFNSADASVTDAKNYFNALSTIRAKAEDKGVPFWSYVQLGGDWRDAQATTATVKDAIPTEAETYWQINMPLAFGAKGIEYFTLIQPYYYSYDDESGSLNCADIVHCNASGVDCGHWHDFDRNSLIGADGQPTTHYAYAKKANKQIAAVDEVLMKATSKGVIAAGTQAVNNTSGLSSIISGTDILNRLEVKSDYGALVGCFDYKDTEAYYVVNYDVTAAQNITLGFSSEQTYSVIMDGAESVGKGSEVTLEIAPGEGVLIVLDEEKTTKYVYFDDISPYRNADGVSHTAPTLEGYLFAGWFKRDSDKAATVSKTKTSGSAYAKFVDEDLLNVTGQVRYGDLNNIDKMSLRFITTVDSLQYSTMGFELAYNDKVKQAESSGVYLELDAWSEDNQQYCKYEPQDLCVPAQYFKAYTLKNIPIDSFNTPIEAKAYWVTLDGTKVYGESSVKKVYQGIECLTTPEAYEYDEITISDFGIVGDAYSKDYHYGTINGQVTDLEGKYLNADVILPDNGNAPAANGTRISFATNDQGGWQGIRVYIQEGKLCIKDTNRAYDLEQYGIKAGERFNLKLSIKDIDTTNNTCTVGVWINNMFAGCVFDTYTERTLGNALSVASVSPCGTVMIGRPTK